ncbi:MAG: TIGR00341 family protein [Acidimicrobiia bacterium]
MTPVESIWGKIREREPWTDEEREQTLDDLFPGDHKIIPYLKRFATLMILSTMIASFGLIANSAAVVIGAMLVAPLMTPMLALAASLMYAEMRRFVGSLTLIIVGTLGAIVTGWLVAKVAGGTLTAASLSPELLARTAPSLLDLGIAIAAGLAGGYVLTHKGAGTSLPGVAIAVALVPPLATVGVALEFGAVELALGALLLYTTNLIAIVLSASIVMFISGFVPDYVRQLARGHLGLRLLPWGLALVAIAIPLGLHTKAVLEDEAFVRDVTSAVEEWDPQSTIIRIDADRSGSSATVSLTVATTTSELQPAWKLAESITTKHGVELNLDVRYQQESTDAASTS